MTATINLNEQLKHHFGFDSFKGDQEAIIRNLLEGNDTFVLMPTGGGKSLCYQLPSLIMEGTAIVVSPLIALMKNQVDVVNGLSEESGVAHYLNSSLNRAAINQVYKDVHEGRTKLLYVAPESLNKEDNLEFFRSFKISFYAIDEAHCISEWGHDFRPEYRNIRPTINKIGAAPVIALTATATDKVRMDIKKSLGITDAKEFKSSFNRANLYYEVRQKTNDIDKQIIKFIKQHPGKSGIIYCISRKKVEELAAVLKANDIKAAAYHAGLDSATRSQTQDDFLMERIDVIVATIAFGMGIDKPDVRFVVHLDLPKNVEGYYQETGRAGRDGDPAHCLLLYSAADMAQLLYFARQIEDEGQRGIAEKHAYAMLEYAERNQCRRKALLAYFGEDFAEPNCGGCDVCTGEIQEEDYTIEAQKALSAMVRSGCRFGRVLIMDILMGADNRRIRETGFQHLPTYGVGKDRTRRFWKYLIDALIRQGLVAVEGEEYPYLRVTEAGWGTLRGAPFRALRIVETRARRNRAERDGTAQGVDVDDTLFQLLRAERRRLAEAAQVPPYVVFHDRALREMAAGKPDSREAMLGIAGVG
ncbi:DNA helicase RecQ, partial [Leyella stercorea]|uniref:DNA helicase RecQ n=1 Tax=Leyella stercorea TaxID=363265 RepID=UPI003AF9B941